MRTGRRGRYLLPEDAEMSTLRRPLVLGLSTCALLLLSARGSKRGLTAGPRERSALKPACETKASVKIEANEPAAQPRNRLA